MGRLRSFWAPRYGAHRATLGTSQVEVAGLDSYTVLNIIPPNTTKAVTRTSKRGTAVQRAGAR